MSKNPPKRKSRNGKKAKKRQAFPDSATDKPASDPSGPANSVVVSQARRWYLIAVFAVIALGGTYLAQALNNWPAADVPRYTFEVIKTYPHDPGAFTQGLVLEDGIVWESTGKFDGQSSVRKVDLETGKIIEQVSLPPEEFGEGLAMVGDKLYQLTWKNGICHVYDRELNKIKDFDYRGHGWGLTYDGTDLIMSDGSSRIYFIDPETFEDRRVITVLNGRRRIDRLNELEYSGGKIYANRLDWDSVYEIDPNDGKVVGIIDLTGLWKKRDRPREGVLNGIAVDSKTGRLIVTGKYCPKIYEIRLVGQDKR